MASDNVAAALLGRDRSPFLPDVVWQFQDGRDVRIDRRESYRAWQDAADADCALVTQWDDGATEDPEFGLPTCSASMPSMVRQMLDACDVREGQRVLEVGTGTGYTAALLRDRVGPSGSVVTVEVDRVLADQARNRLAAAGVDVEVRCGDGLEGWPDHAPYDRVHVTCGIRRIPSAWLTQCPNGIVMMPWGPTTSEGCDHVVALTVEDGVGIGRLGPEVAFMKARTQRPRPWPDWPDTGETTAADLPVGLAEIDELLETSGAFLMSLLVPELRCRLFPGVDGEDERVWWLERSGSYASIGFGHDGATTVEGDPDLIADCTEAVRWWHDNARPPLQAFGLRAAPDGEFARQDIWFGTPDRLLSTWLTPHRRKTVEQ